MLTQIDFDGELKLVEDDDVMESEPPHKRWAKLLPRDEDATYTGPNRRRGERRKNGDRRELVRFQENTDRRSGKDRRSGVWGIKHTI
ncbi:MAG: hypothetical protein MUC77_01305 [Chromatiaceae bacterium]|jgi:hypothetical protein|nr:hypothetical protein [Chromatiaceae bacterium]